jgi:DNA (cytosine-5)-methyltransferase 1
VIIARQDKAPLYLIQAEAGTFNIPVYDTDSEVMIRIKVFMACYGIVDIKMRMLRVHELLRIQGFPPGYKLEGNQADQKKFIGNSVVPLVVKKWTEALGARLIETYHQKIA